VTLIGDLQLFLAFTNCDDNLVKALVLGLAVFIPIWIAFAEDIRGYFFACDNEAFEPIENKLPHGPQRELPPRSVGGEIDLNSDAENEGQREVKTH
jgi:hypothetical protein